MTRALITGCSTGIGRATAVELTKRGYEVVATARRLETIDDLDVAHRLPLDVDDDTSVAAARDAAGEVDVLVNNAGFGLTGPIEAVPVDAVRRLFETNVLGALRTIQAFLPGMRERRRGAIVNVSSVSGRVGTPLSGAYSASKFALEGMSEALHIEASHFGIRTILVEPGFIATAFGDNRRDHPVEGSPYEPLAAAYDRVRANLKEGGEQGPELVAAVIAEALEADTPRLRWPAGADAELVCGARAAMDDESFEAAMRSQLGLDW